MSGFSAEWLTLREPHDLRARNPAVLGAVAAFFALHSQVRVADLACGTGSTLRALRPLLPAQQHWKLVDNDPALLARATANHPTITAVTLDLSRDLESAFDETIDLVTTSALLDLVSERWLQRLADAIVARKIPFYAALSYDGRVDLTPPDPLDNAIINGVNAHQRTDKGFGPALGPDAAAFAIGRFEAQGYRVTHGTSDWIIGADAADMQTEILSGWTSAAYAAGALPMLKAAAWLQRRGNFVAAGASSLEVGHIDFFAAPSGTR